jgi:hypothetical protein
VQQIERCFGECAGVRIRTPKTGRPHRQVQRFWHAGVIAGALRPGHHLLAEVVRRRPEARQSLQLLLGRMGLRRTQKLEGMILSAAVEDFQRCRDAIALPGSAECRGFEGTPPVVALIIDLI